MPPVILEPGQIIRVRSRQYLVEEVIPSGMENFSVRSLKLTRSKFMGG